MSTTVLLTAHFFDPSIEASWRRLRRETPADWRILIALNCGDEPERIPAAAAALPATAFYLCSNRSFLALPYPVKCNPAGWRLNPGNVDLVSLLFMAQNPEVEHVWGIEYDVHYEGDWSTLFGHFADSTADLLATAIRSKRETPKKMVVPPLQAPSFRPYLEADRMYAFLPLFRLSRRGASAIDRAYRAGAAGHYELTWATILHGAGLTLEDIGGDGAFVRPENVDRFYFNTPASFSLGPGTFVFRPPLRNVIRRANTLWHPVKPPIVRNWYAIRFRFDNPLKNAIETVKPYANRLLIRAWFITRWNPLR